MEDFSGTWDILSSPDLDYIYLSLETTPYLTIHQREIRIEGEYQVGLQCGRILGHLGDENFFYFGGNDEMEEAHGSGEGTLEEGRLTFECVRRG